MEIWVLEMQYLKSPLSKVESEIQYLKSPLSRVRSWMWVDKLEQFWESVALGISTMDSTVLAIYVSTDITTSVKFWQSPWKSALCMATAAQLILIAIHSLFTPQYRQWKWWPYHWNSYNSQGGINSLHFTIKVGRMLLTDSCHNTASSVSLNGFILCIYAYT